MSYDYKDPGTDPAYCDRISERRDPINAAKSAFVALENALGEIWDELPAQNNAKVGDMLKAIEAVHGRFSAVFEQEERDEAYERTAARYDGEGKDWR